MTLDLKDGFGLHAEALMLRERRSVVLQSNIANAATPGYLARDFDFETALRQADAGQPATPDLGYRVPMAATLDGNTVDMAVEQVAFSENTLRYQASLDFLNRRIASLTAAIKGE